MAQEQDGQVVANNTVQKRASWSSTDQLFQERDTGSHSGQCDHTGLVQESDKKYTLWQAKPEHELKMHHEHAAR